MVPRRSKGACTATGLRAGVGVAADPWWRRGAGGGRPTDRARCSAARGRRGGGPREAGPEACGHSNPINCTGLVVFVSLHPPCAENRVVHVMALALTTSPRPRSALGHLHPPGVPVQLPGDL